MRLDLRDKLDAYLKPLEAHVPPGLGESIASLILGCCEPPGVETYPAEPLLSLVKEAC